MKTWTHPSKEDNDPVPESGAKPKEKLSSSHHSVLKILFKETVNQGWTENLANSPVKHWVLHQLVLAQVLLEEGKDKDGGGRPGNVVESEVDAVVERLYGEVVVEAVEEDAWEAGYVLVEEVMDEQSNPIVVPVAMN